MDAGRGIGGARPARDEADAGAAAHLADCLGHDRRRAFVPANRKLNVASVEGVEGGQIAFARDAGNVAHSEDRQLIDQDFAAGARAIIGSH